MLWPQLLNSMVCYERDLDDEYYSKFYDMATMMRNIGGQGGLTLVNSIYFEWGMRAMRIVINEFTVYEIIHNPHNADRTARKAIINNTSLKSDFTLLCVNNSDATHPVILSVFEIVMTKVINARFGEVRKNYSRQQEALKVHGKANFRTGLLVMTQQSKGKKSNDDTTRATQAPQADATQQSDATQQQAVAANANASSLIPTAATTSRVVILSPGSNGALDDKKLLKGKSFVLIGSYVEVHSNDATATESVSDLLKSFGATVLTRFSKNTSELLIFVQ